MAQVVLGGLVMMVSMLTVLTFYSAGFCIRNEEMYQLFYGTKDGANGCSLKSLAARVEVILAKMDSLQDKLETTMQQMDNSKDGIVENLECIKFLKEKVIEPLEIVTVALRQIQLPKAKKVEMEEPLTSYFITEEIRQYISAKVNRHGKVNPYGTERIHNTIGHACVLMKKELEEYMDYDIGSYCKDDWHLAQRLMLNGCDPLPRRRCLTRASKLYQKPYPIKESLWRLPDVRNVGWSNYQCRNFECIATKNPNSKCAGCFDMEKEKLKWVCNSSLPVYFLISDVLAIKPGELRIGLDFGIGTGTFAARMRENNVTIITTALNLGAPFNEMIALRGLIPLYVTLNQRLPFFDNTMDMIHTEEFLGGWIDLSLLEFMLFDWDRILRPGGMLWIDRFFCHNEDFKHFVYMFLQLRYKKHKWAVFPKTGDEVYLSALLEKPPRSL